MNYCEKQKRLDFLWNFCIYSFKYSPKRKYKQTQIAKRYMHELLGETLNYRHNKTFQSILTDLWERHWLTDFRENMYCNGKCGGKFVTIQRITHGTEKEGDTWRCMDCGEIRNSNSMTMFCGICLA